MPIRKAQMSKRSKGRAIVALALITAAAMSASRPSTKASVYAAVFSGDHWNLDPLSKLVVKGTAIRMPSLAGSSANWLMQWDEIPQALRRVAEQPQPTSDVSLSPSLFPAGTRLVADRAVEAVFRPREGAPEANWALFRRQFAAAGRVAFSDIVFTADETDALVYYEGRCGSLYGIGAYVWLHRNGVGSAWVIRKRIVSWVS